MKLEIRATMVRVKESTQKKKVIFICDQGLRFKVLLVNVCNHGKPYNFTIIKVLIGYTSRFWYLDDFYRLSWNIFAPSPNDSHHIYLCFIKSLRLHLIHPHIHTLSTSLAMNYSSIICIDTKNIHPINSIHVFLALVVVAYT